jgi:hypothetical protein
MTFESGQLPSPLKEPLPRESLCPCTANDDCKGQKELMDTATYAQLKHAKLRWERT